MRGSGAFCWGALAAVALAASAMAAPVLPQGAGEAEIEAWIDAYVEPGSEMRGVNFDEAVEYYDPSRLMKLPDGHVLVPFRLEYWRPQREGRTTWRSERQQVEVDCQTHRFRFLSIEGFTENNLKGRAARLAPDVDWSKSFGEDSVDGLELRQVCSFASLLGTPQEAVGAPPPPAGFEEDVLDAWFNRHTQAGHDVLLHREGGLASYYTPADLERLPKEHVRAWVRRELAFPMVLGGSGVRSTRMQYEIDCAHRRYRTLDLIVFPGQNLVGPAYADFLTDQTPIQSIEAGASDTVLLRALCALSRDSKLSPVEAMRQPPVPALEESGKEAAQAWIRTNINTAGYVVNSYGGKFAVLYAPESLELLRNGHIVVSVRLEAFKPPEEGGGRSMLLRTEIDCAGRRTRILDATVFSESNLEGESEEKDGSDWRRAEKDTHEALLMPELCAQRTLLSQEIDREAALTPPPASDDEDGIIAWVAEHVRPLGYVYVDYSDDGVALYSWNEGERTRQDHVRVWTRQEYFDPRIQGDLVTRSVRQLMEYDCEQGRSRVLAVEAYPGANLTGKAVTRRPPSADWSFISPNTLNSALSNAVCELADEADEADGDAVSAPRLPRRGDSSAL